MGYKLRVNNRKEKSGGILEAKIVSPDKQAIQYKIFPIQVQEQGLSDKECIIRDVQYIAATLNSGNASGTMSWEYVTERIKGLDEILDYMNNEETLPNGSKLESVAFVGDDDHAFIDENGIVISQPKYKSDATVDEKRGKSLQLYIYLSKGNISYAEASQDSDLYYHQEFWIPPYDGAKIVAKISNILGDYGLWNYIRKDNINHTQVFGPVKTIEDGDTNFFNSSIFTTNGVSIIGTLVDRYSDITITPKSSPSYTITNSEGTESPIFEAIENGIDASSIYKLDRNEYDISVITKLSQINSNSAVEDENKLKVPVAGQSNNAITNFFVSNGVNITAETLGKNATAMPIAYVVSKKVEDENDKSNTIAYEFSVDGEKQTVEVKGISFMSKPISIRDIANNISSSINKNWLLPMCSDNYEIVGDIAHTEANNPVVIKVPNNKNLIMKLPVNIDSLVTAKYHDGTSNNKYFDIQDTNNIGYYTDYNGSSTNVNKPVGYQDSLITMSLELTGTTASKLFLVRDGAFDMGSGNPLDRDISEDSFKSFFVGKLTHSSSNTNSYSLANGNGGFNTAVPYNRIGTDEAVTNDYVHIPNSAPVYLVLASSTTTSNSDYQWNGGDISGRFDITLMPSVLNDQRQSISIYFKIVQE